MGFEQGHILVTYYAPAWGPNTNGEEVVYFLKQVTFESESEQRTRIYFCSINPDGSDRKEIAWLWKDQPDQFFENFAVAVRMEVSSATRQAAIGVEQGQRGGIFVAGLDGKGFHSVWPRGWNEDRPTKAGYPTWSPDGQWIAFHEYRFEGGSNLFRIVKCKTDGSAYTPLTERNGCNAEPAWSPTTNVIAYINYPQYYPGGRYLWLMNGDGGDKRETKNWGDRPTWSRDGTRILHSGILLVDANTGEKIRDWRGAWKAYPKWGKAGFIEVGPLDISLTDSAGNASHPLLKNVSRKGGVLDVDKEAFRW
jgi:hypothetical protein